MKEPPSGKFSSSLSLRVEWRCSTTSFHVHNSFDLRRTLGIVSSTAGSATKADPSADQTHGRGSRQRNLILSSSSVRGGERLVLARHLSSLEWLASSSFLLRKHRRSRWLAEMRLRTKFWATNDLGQRVTEYSSSERRELQIQAHELVQS
ncbi:hypothetical protein ACOSQ4_028521 [Xanthoceras sorbifolium]